MTNTPNNTEAEYELKDIVNYCSTDPKGLVLGSRVISLPEKIVNQLNYARALNGNPHRLIKVDPCPL